MARWCAVVLTIFSTSLAFVSCAGPAPKHQYTLSPGHAHHAGIARAMVVPINESMDVPAGLEVADRRIEGLLDDYLGSMGVSTQRPETRRYRRAVRVASRRARAIASSGESGRASENVSYEDIIPALLEELGVGADIVVVPNLVIRDGIATGGQSYKWDGVRRYETGTVQWDITGEFPVASFFVTVYESKGMQIFSGYGGLDTVFEFSPERRDMSIREDLLQNKKFLKQGICIAFHPYFGEDERC